MTAKYTMRRLKTGDIYKMSKILKKMNIKFDVDAKTTQEQMGIQMIQKIVENLYLAEKEVNGFLAELVDIKAEDFNELPLGDIVEIFSLFKGQDDISAFLKLAGQ